MTPADATEAEKNGKLLVELKDRFRARGLNIGGFFDVGPEWRCPCCFRSKVEIARLDVNGNLLCRIVRHHDHFEDLAGEQLRSNMGRLLDYGALSVVSSSFARFRPELICEDCNNADNAAKVAVDAKAAFTFAPHEISGFIHVKPNTPHEINCERALAIYKAILPSMGLLAERLRATKRARDGDGHDADWKSLGALSDNIINSIRPQAKKGAAE
jgi:hypothetical protein